MKWKKSLLKGIGKDDSENFTLQYHYEIGIKSFNRAAELLFVDYQKFPNVAIITYKIAKGIGG